LLLAQCAFAFPIHDDKPVEEDASQDGSVDAPGDDPTADADTIHCASLSKRPLFCADFDEGTGDAGWTGETVKLGSVAVDSNHSRSPPSALLASTESSSTQSPEAVVVWALPTPIGGARLAFNLYVAQADPSVRYVKFAGISFPNGSDLLYQHGSADSVVEGVPGPDGGSTYVGYPLVRSPALATWSHIEIHLIADATGTIIAIEVLVDGIVVLPASAIAGKPAGAPSLLFGLFSVTAPTAPWQVYFDDIVLTAD
jgi:hypothetical protein